MLRHIANFIEEVRDGLADRDSFDMASEWLEKAQQNLVPLTIVFVFICMVGSCAGFAISSLARQQAAQAPPQDERSAANPWALEKAG